MEGGYGVPEIGLNVANVLKGHCRLSYAGQSGSRRFTDPC